MRERKGEQVRAFAPATVGNLACGFDVFGLAVEAPGDVVGARHGSGPGVVISDVQGDGGRLPRDTLRNSAGVSAAAVLRHLGVDAGIDLTLRKGLPLSAGMGGSASSAVAAAVAVDALLGTHLPWEVLLACALEGERIAAGAPHPDNAAPALLGGITLVRSRRPLDVLRLPVPQGMAVALVRPHLEMETREARRVLGDHVRLSDATVQWANASAFVAGLYTGDWDLIARSLTDVIAEPLRAPKVPGFPSVKDAALSSGALGASLSGSGPTVFALCRTVVDAQRAGEAMRQAFETAASLPSDVHVSRVSHRGARILEEAPPGGAGPVT